MSFSEFCRDQRVTDEEREKLIVFLATLRAMNTVVALRPPYCDDPNCLLRMKEPHGHAAASPTELEDGR